MPSRILLWPSSGVRNPWGSAHLDPSSSFRRRSCSRYLGPQSSLAQGATPTPRACVDPFRGSITPGQTTLRGAVGCCVLTVEAAGLPHAWHSAESENLNANLASQVLVNVHLSRYVIQHSYTFEISGHMVCEPPFVFLLGALRMLEVAWLSV